MSAVFHTWSNLTFKKKYLTSPACQKESVTSWNDNFLHIFTNGYYIFVWSFQQDMDKPVNFVPVKKDSVKFLLQEAIRRRKMGFLPKSTAG